MDRRMLMLSGAALLGSATRSWAAPATPFNSDRFTVVVEGQGPDVILVPGLSSSREVFADLVAAMKSRYRFHRVQVNGFAGLPAGGNASGPVAAPVAEELARYITATGLNKPAVIGHSMGGSIGMMLAARHPDLVGRLMVVDMGPNLAKFFVGWNATPEQATAMAAQVQEAIAHAPKDAYEKQADATLAGMVKTESARPALIQQSRASDRDVAARSMAELITTDLTPELSKITAPVTVLYVWTPAYPASPEQVDLGYKMLFGDVKTVKLVRIPDSYHFIMIDQPERFRQEVESFLGG